ncbi:hypothetical protein ACOME3_008343 [Neoechinorhynchus agilis]
MSTPSPSSEMDDLSMETDYGIDEIPYQRRETTKRIFVNRLLNLQDVKFYGFDMDYTLAIYKSPYFEAYVFNLVVKKLVAAGYPEEILALKYNPEFPIRGLWFDKVYGNFLKVDSNHNILLCIHGFTKLGRNMVEPLYPNAYVTYDPDRYVVLDSLFNLPEIYLLAALVNHFSVCPDYKIDPNGVTTKDDVYISYEAICEDVRSNTDLVHQERDLKTAIAENLEDFIVKSPQVKTMLERIRQYGAKSFLLTNSDYWYTNIVMPFLLETKDWNQYFDYIVVDARKPAFFAEGTPLRKFNAVTKKMSMGHYRDSNGYRCGPIERSTVYSGGSCKVFSKLIGAQGKDVLYVGDHIYGDIIRSKKQRAWRTFLVIPELEHELKIFHLKRNLFKRIDKLYGVIAMRLMTYDSTAIDAPDFTNEIKAIKEVRSEMDRQYGLLGSLFRKGAYQTQFSSQVSRYADIYATSSFKILNYPFFYLFRASPMLLPHESTVNPAQPYSALMSPTPSGFGSEASIDARFEIKSISAQNVSNPEGVANIIRERALSGEASDESKSNNEKFQENDEDDVAAM